MFIDVYTAVFLWTFAIFGLMLSILKIYQSIKCAKKSGKKRLDVIISAKNQQDRIEGIIRELIFEAKQEYREDLLLGIILVDAASSDETQDIMARLEKEYSFLECLELDELLGYMEDIKN